MLFSFCKDYTHITMLIIILSFFLISKFLFFSNYFNKRKKIVKREEKLIFKSIFVCVRSYPIKKYSNLCSVWCVQNRFGKVYPFSMHTKSVSNFVSVKNSKSEKCFRWIFLVLFSSCIWIERILERETAAKIRWRKCVKYFINNFDDEDDE